MRKSPRNSKGFTLVETLVAISVLVMAVTGAFAAAQNGISSAIYSKDQIVAFYLAQEGVEYVRNIRDENGLSGSGWLTGIPIQTPFSIDAVNDALTPCITTCSNISLNDNGFYAYDSGDETTFNREVLVEEVEAGREMAITVRVTWSKGLVTRAFVARENIFNWQ